MRANEYEKQCLSSKIEKQTKQFLERGGKIEKFTKAFNKRESNEAWHYLGNPRRSLNDYY